LSKQKLLEIRSAKWAKTPGLEETIDPQSRGMLDQYRCSVHGCKSHDLKRMPGGIFCAQHYLTLPMCSKPGCYEPGTHDGYCVDHCGDITQRIRDRQWLKSEVLKNEIVLRDKPGQRTLHRLECPGIDFDLKEERHTKGRCVKFKGLRMTPVGIYCFHHFMVAPVCTMVGCYNPAVSEIWLCREHDKILGAEASFETLGLSSAAWFNEQVTHDVKTG
jgi:hypothetical protein